MTAICCITKLLYDRAPNHKLTDFVLRYLHFDKISAMGERKFTTDYCKWAKKQGYILYEHQAKEIFALVQNGIPALPMTASTTIVVKEAIRVVRELENSRASILAQMQTFAKSLPEYSLIRSMACVGDTLTPLVIAEIGDIRNFHSKHALIAYAGIDAPPYQSGGFYGTERDFSQKTTVLTCLPYTQDDRSGCNITKSLDFSMLLSYFDLRQKKNICKFRLHFHKSVQTFHAKVVCPTFRDRPPSLFRFLHFRRDPFL